MGAHIDSEGRFQSDRYPTCPPGKVPLSVQDPTAQDLLWEYAQRRRAVDAEFSADLEAVLTAAGFSPRRAPMQASEWELSGDLEDRSRRRPSGSKGTVPGTISWAEHERCWIEYARRYPGQSAERMAERDGFSWQEYVLFVGAEPASWRPGRGRDR